MSMSDHNMVSVAEMLSWLVCKGEFNPEIIFVQLENDEHPECRAVSGTADHIFDVWFQMWRRCLVKDSTE